MKRTLQFALPLLVPAALLFAAPVFSQGNSQRGDRSGANSRGNGAGRQEQRMGGLDRGTQRMGGGQERSMGNPSRSFEQRGSQGRSQAITPNGAGMQMSERSFDPRAGQQRSTGRNDNRNGSYSNPSSPAQNGSRPQDYGRSDNRTRNYGSPSTAPQRDVRTPAPSSRDRVYSGSSRDGRNNPRYDNRNYSTNRGPSYAGKSYPGYNRPSRPYSPPVRWNYRYPYRGQSFASLSFGYNPIPFGGYNYYYNSGVWYRPFGSYYRVIAPPRGISINILPFGYSRISVGSSLYYYYGSTYYMPRNNGYVVVDPPLGAKLPALPVTAKEVFINSQRLFEDDGTYYMEEYNINNQRLYTVVGVHGSLNQGQVDQISQGTGYSTSYDPGLITVLPANSRRVSISGQEYFLSPEDVYYQEITDGDNVSYQVVGM